MKFNRRTLTRRDWTRMLAYGLRRNRTVSEKRLWRCIKDRQLLGFKFRQQAPISHWIADFYCPAARLVVEVDGPSHRARIENDRRRDKAMAEMGLNVLRIRSELVMNDLECALGQIEWALRCSGADPVTESDSVRLRQAEGVWHFSTPAAAEVFLRSKLAEMNFDVPG